MTHIEIRWPDEMAERIRVARGRLERAGERLRSIPLEERLRTVAQIVDDWTTPDSPWRRELAATFGEASPFDVRTVREGLDGALQAWEPAALVRCAKRELASVLEPNGLTLSPFPWTAVLAGGAIPMPTLLSALLPLILGSPVLMRETTNDSVTAALLKRSLVARDESFARAFESISIQPEDPAFEVLLEAPCVVATGSDETIRSLGARLRPSQRFVAYGHRFSIAVLGPDLAGDEAGMIDVAEGIALDVARWDQTGCLSPIVVYLVGIEASHEKRIAAAIAEALANLSQRMPRGEVPTAIAASHATERAEARMRQASQTAMLFEGDDFTVVLESNATARPAPLYRFLRLMPVESVDELNRALGPFAGHLSSVSVSGFSNQQRRLEEDLSRLGVSRFTRSGRLQTPPIDWPHDGMPLLTPLARFVMCA